MRTLPEDLSPEHGEQLTGMVCPDCAGSLEVQTLGGHGHLHFVCRIGHAYSLTELLEAKENRIEERLWSAVVALEEMAKLLDDLIGAAGRLGLDAWTQVFQDRAENAREHARQIRSVIERERPVRVSQQEPSPEGDRPRAERG